MHIFYKHKFVFILFFLIITLGSFLRVHKLNEIPPGLTIDELSIGYNAFTLASNGIDQDGNFLPITHFRSVEDYKLPVYIYVVAFFQKFLSNEFTVIRLPAALFSIFTIIVTFFLAKTLFGKRVALLAAFLFAISPWNIFHSHLGLETNAGLFFALLSILFLYLSLKRKMFFFFSIMSFILTIYTHHVFWIFLPTLFFIFFIIHKEYFFKKITNTFVLGLLSSIILIVPLLIENNSGNEVRLNQSLFSQKRIIEARNKVNYECGSFDFICIPLGITLDISRQVTSQYVSAYSLITLYAPSGFDNVDVMPNRGLFYYFEFPLMIIGIIVLLKRGYSKISIFLIAWLLIYPMPVALTNNISATRMYPLLPLPQILEALALYTLLRKRFFLTVGFIFIVTFSLVRFISDYWFIYSDIYSRYVGYGPIAIINYVDNKSDNNFYIEEPLFNKLYLSYFYKILPQNENSSFKDKRGIIITYHENIFVVERGYLPEKKRNNILISFREDVPIDYKQIGEINLKDNSMYAVISSPK